MIKKSNTFIPFKVIGLGFFFAGVSIAEENKIESLSAEELGKLPELSFGRNEAFESAVHLLDPEKAILKMNDMRYAGFRFTVPGMLDGPLEWLSVSVTSDRDIKPWLVLSMEGNVIATTEPTVSDISAFPRLVAQFPKAHTISTHQIRMVALKQGGQYSVVQPLEEDQASPVAVSITVASPIGRFQYGDLNPKVIIPPRQMTNEEVMASILKAREETSVNAAIDILSHELDQRADDQIAYTSLYRMAWVEAQTGSGRLDNDWSARIYDALFTHCWKHRYYQEVLDVTSNLTRSLWSAGRSGRASEVLDWWCEAQQLGGYQMVSTNYRDLGPALSMLPEVRKRDIPELKAFSNATYQGDHPKDLDGRFDLLTAVAFLDYAHHLHRAGRWRESLEWKLWIHQWASVKGGHDPREDMASVWYDSLQSILGEVRWMGFTEKGIELAEQGLAAPHGDNYLGRSNLLLASNRFDMLMELDHPVPDIVKQVEALVAQAESNIHMNINGHHSVKVTLAKALIHTNRRTEGMALLDKLVEEGSIYARTIRLRERIEGGDYDQVEKELLALLANSRESGNKSAETLLYRDYAKFLEKTGRDQEALLINRELIRICRSFDYFTILPLHLARLASLLERLGDTNGSKLAADEARALLAQGRLPKGNAEMTHGILAGLNAGADTAAEKTENAPLVDFQPGRSVVIPIEGAPWTTLLSLANPGTHPEVGTLSANGIPVSFTWDETQGDLLARLHNDEQDGTSPLPLRLEPGSYQLIKITADETFATVGEMTFAWTSDRDKTRVEAKVGIELPESGVSSSIIQAGNYQLNPFYGVPIHHHYVTKEKATESLPLRFVASHAARVEVYALDGAPLCIDAQGNGSLRDAGDELFGSTDRKGNLLLPLKAGSSSFMILLYPSGPLPKEGITLNVEACQNESWTLHSQNRILP